SCSARQGQTSVDRDAAGTEPCGSCCSSHRARSWSGRCRAAAGPTKEPGAAFLRLSALQGGSLVATGRRQRRLPAGFGSPHGRTGGAKAWGNVVVEWVLPGSSFLKLLIYNMLQCCAGACADLNSYFRIS